MQDNLVIMVIDDNETDNLITSRIIELGYPNAKLICQTSAKQALRYLTLNSKESKQLPDLIFLDIQMPIMNGVDFLYELDKHSDQFVKDPRVIMLSGYEKVTDKILKSNRVMDYLPKPLTPATIAKIIKTFSAIQLKVA